MPNAKQVGTYAKRAKQETKKRQRHGLLVFFGLLSLPSAGNDQAIIRKHKE
jgi:hypothetical protein